MDRWEKIEQMLSQVSKPTRYIGSEINALHKDHRSCQVKVALAFPDVYEIGMSHLGLKILYKILNDLSGVVAERAYAPWHDLATLMEKEGIPLFSLESKAPLRNFDIVGFTLQHELSYTNILWMLRLAGIPLRAKERRISDPLIIAGGPCAVNPEPLADFIDVFCVGDGEEFIKDLVSSFIENKGCEKDKLFASLAQIPGAYVPSLYEADYDNDGRFRALRPKNNQAPYPIQRRLEGTLDALSFPTRQIIPFMEIIHDRATLEIQRGCSQGCRFCQAGMIYRPVRERSLKCLKEQAERLIAQTGYEEISFSSLSITDYGEVRDLISWFIREFGQGRIAVSLPSLRVDSLSPHLADLVSKIKKTGLTLAPEAGSARLRRVINKRFCEEDLLEMVEACFRSGWHLIKLYFMIGLPTEKEEDIEAIVELVGRMKKVSGRGRELKVSISPFVPKPHTPFQWEGQLELKELRERMGYLQRRLRRMRWIRLSWHQLEVSFLEAVFARGDRRLAEVLILAHKKGCRFDSWTDEFRFDLWEEAFKETGVDPAFYANRRIDLNEPLPWNHISVGVKKEYLGREYKKACGEETTPDCRESGCVDCGACVRLEGRAQRAEDPEGKPSASYGASRGQEAEGRRQRAGGRGQRRIQTSQKFRVRLELTKGEEVRHLSHLNMMKTFDRAIRRTDIPIAFSQGYNPHQRLSFGPALKVGVISSSEYIDLELASAMNVERLKEALNQSLPSGINIRNAALISPRAKSLSSIINLSTYQIKMCSKEFLPLDEAIQTFLKKDEIWILRNDKRVEVRKSVRDIQILQELKEEVSTLEITLRVQNGSAKIDEVLKSLLPSCRIITIERTGQYHLNGKELVSPMEMRV